MPHADEKRIFSNNPVSRLKEFGAISIINSEKIDI